MNRAEVYVLGGRDVGRSFVVEDEAHLGRDATCEIRLGDRSVSRRHARITFDGLQWVVEDMGSRNGVSISGKRVERTTLRDHDEFLLGEVPIRFRLSEELRPASAAAQPAQAELDELDQDEIVLEEALEEGLPLPEAASTSQETVLAAAAPRPARPAEERAAPPSRLSRRDELLASSTGRGLLRGDFEQQPLWVRGLALLALLAVAIGIVFVVFRLVQGVRGTL